MHIFQVFLRKNVDCIVKKLTSAQSFPPSGESRCSSSYSTQHLYMEWSCNKTGIFANMNLAIAATYVVFTQDTKKKLRTHIFHHKYTFTM